MSDWNDDMNFTDDEFDDDIEIGGRFYTPSEDDEDDDSNVIASFSFETPAPSKTKQKKSKVSKAITSNDEKYYSRCYRLKESTLRKLIMLTVNEESLYFNISNIVDTAINYYYDNTLKR